MISARRISPAARRRRALLADLVGGALLGTLLLLIAPGLGYIAFFGLPLMLLLGLWVLAERGLTYRRRHRRRRGRGRARRNVSGTPALSRTARDR